MKLAAAISSVLALSLASAARAAGEPLVFSGAHGGSFLSEPAKLKYSADVTGGVQSLKLRRLHWNHWGQAKAIAHGRLKACSHANGCFAHGAEVKAKRLVESNGDGFTRSSWSTSARTASSSRCPRPCVS
jgi:hypothetical protein